MERYCFILGKNPVLSSAEIVSYLRNRKIRFNVQDHGKGFLILDCSAPPKIEDLGGTIKIAKVLSSTNQKTLPDKDIADAAKTLPRKCIFGVSSYGGTSWKDLANLIKSKAGSQAKFMNIPVGRSSLTHVEVIKKSLISESAEFLALSSGKNLHLAQTIEVHNPFEFQKRDMDRPFKRPMLSIPPRLARIMVNLSGKGKGILLDPFCGIGTVLQEAALMGFTFWGVDTNNDVIPWARRNLKWLLRSYDLSSPGFEERIQRGDARKLPDLFPINSIDAIVTEPDLGPALKRKPDLNRARRITRKLTPLYERFLRGSKEILKSGGTIVVVSPRFELKSGPPVRINMEALASRAGLEIVNPFKGSGLDHGLPLTDHEEYHKTIREITILKALRK